MCRSSLYMCQHFPLTTPLCGNCFITIGISSSSVLLCRLTFASVQLWTYLGLPNKLAHPPHSPTLALQCRPWLTSTLQSPIHLSPSIYLGILCNLRPAGTVTTCFILSSLCFRATSQYLCRALGTLIAG